SLYFFKLLGVQFRVLKVSYMLQQGILSYENEVLQSVFMNKESELEKQPLYNRFVTAGGMHAVPPPMTGNYMPFGPDIENITPVVNESNVECQPKVWSDAPIIEEYDSDSEGEYVSRNYTLS
ncbi:hypothetical protein Tco_0175899, partial [Tanacetum coccineum]